MGGGSSSPKYIDPVIITNNNYHTNNQGLINSQERFNDFSDNYYEYRHMRYLAILFGILIGLILVLLFFKRKKRR